MGEWSNGTTTWDLLNDCIQGQGGTGGDPTEPQGDHGTTDGELPAELPMTGSNQTLSSLIIIIATITTYGVVYFAQPRRNFEN